MIDLLVFLLIVLVCAYLLMLVVGWLGLTNPIRQVVYLIAALIVLLLLLDRLGLYSFR